jgi:hypothetical protein
MSLINGLSSLGSGLNTFAGNAAVDAEAQARTPLLSSPAPTPTATAPEKLPTSYGDPSAPGPRMPAGPNPYGDSPHARALWLAERAIMGPESGGKADAQNPTSSAGGLFQITNGTFSAALQKMGIAPPQSQAELNAMKYNRDLNTKVMRTINADAAAALDAAGLPVSVATLQAAHRLGPTGAAAAIKAAMQDPNAPLVGNGLAPEAVRGNGDIAHLTVGAFLESPYPRSGGS